MSSNVAIVVDQVKYENKSYWRNPLAAVFTFGFPLVLFVILVGVTRSATDKQDLGKGVHLAQYLTPSVLAYAVMSATFVFMTLTLVRQREAGVLKRMRGTPLPSWALIGGFIGNALIIASLLALVCVVFAVTVYGVSLPASHILPLIVTIAISAICFCALGLAVSTFIPNIDAAPAMVNIPFFLLVFISGTYFPVTGTMATIAGYFPLRPFTHALYYEIFNPYAAHGSGWSGHDLGSLAIWGAASVFVAIRRFQWTPRRG
jgi:ABC-2 type transport system permease protein